MKKNILTALLLFFSVFVHAQFSISGHVYDSGKNPLPSVALQVVGTNSGALTNSDGVYLIENLPNGNYQLKASYLGYEPEIVDVKLDSDKSVDIVLQQKAFVTQEVVVRSSRLSTVAPATTSTVGKADIEANNLGQDMPFLLSLQPSVVSTSDAGAGVGYSGFRIRGTDETRINVTIDGVPLNDAESHRLYWVNMPDIANSLENVEIQRGVGSSTNGSASFGASVNMQSRHYEQNPYAVLSSSCGSFGTFKNSVSVGTGLIGGHWSFDARLSKIESDGFIDRASSRLQSYFLSGAYYDERTMLKINHFSGKEVTYQAWNGVPKVRLESDTAGMLRYGEHWLYTDKQVQEMLNSDSRTYNLYTYENEVDDYEQRHFQAFVSHSFGSGWFLNGALYYTYGKGYYEQYKEDDDLSDYGLDNVAVGDQSVGSSDIIRRKCLDNDLYGANLTAQYKTDRLTAVVGGGGNYYDGRHFGTVIWGQFLGDASSNHQYYYNTGKKIDLNAYVKATYNVVDALSAFADVQYRHIGHRLKGIDDDARDVTQTHTFNFVNPKIGVNWKPKSATEFYLMYSCGHREPTRTDFTDTDPNQPAPKSESLHDFEVGAIFNSQHVRLSANAYLMYYRDQLVQTGQINNVGSSLMVNVPKSYRAGLELAEACKLGKMWRIYANLTLSRNQILDFTEYVDDWDNGGQVATHFGTTQISFSPSIVGNGSLTFSPIHNADISLTVQYVGNQYIDNTQSADRMLDAYLVNNFKIGYTLEPRHFGKIRVNLQVNNLFNVEYESNAWVYSYIYEGQRWAQDGYFPQAGTNFLLGVQVTVK